MTKKTREDPRRFALGEVVDLQPRRITLTHGPGAFSHFRFAESVERPESLREGDFIGACYIRDRANPTRKILRYVRRLERIPEQERENV